MSASLSIKNVPDVMVEAIRARAERNHRSMQGELMAILDEAVGPKPFRAAAFMAQIRAIGLKPTGSSTRMIRRMRDSR